MFPFFDRRKKTANLKAPSEPSEKTVRNDIATSLHERVDAIHSNGSRTDNSVSIPSERDDDVESSIDLEMHPEIANGNGCESTEPTSLDAVVEKEPVSDEEPVADRMETPSFDLTASDDPEVQARLASMQTFRVFVAQSGAIHYVEDPARARTLEQLAELVEKKHGRATLHPVKLLEFSKLRSRAVAQADSVSRNDMVSMVLEDAIERKASDIYIAIQRHRTLIHFRTHGVRYLHSEISMDDGKEMARALWSLATKGQYSEAAPTDTAFDFQGFRVRANSMPETRGNSIVLRLRDPKFIPPVRELGYDARQQRLLDDLQRGAGGLSVISGETNSGKSTTLTSLMAGMPATEMIIEIADPIEIEFPNVAHMEFDHYADNADKLFRGILGGLVRQNPDTLFIGEIRDEQSALAAIDMSLQGKRVWGTVHSHSCLMTISRLEHLGIDAHLLGQPGFLTGVINQSLVPLVCDACARDSMPDDAVETVRIRAKYGTDQLRFHNPDGCGECVRGVSGQTVVAEVMTFPNDANHEAQRLVRERDFARLDSCMREMGMTSKAHHAIRKIRKGLLDPNLTEGVIGRIGTTDKLPEDAPKKANGIGTTRRQRQRSARRTTADASSKANGSARRTREIA